MMPSVLERDLGSSATSVGALTQGSPLKPGTQENRQIKMLMMAV